MHAAPAPASRAARMFARAGEWSRGFARPGSPAAEPAPRRSTVERMTDDLLDIAAAGGSAGESDLLLKGWTAEEIARHGPDATRRARRASVRRG